MVEIKKGSVTSFVDYIYDQWLEESDGIMIPWILKESALSQCTM